MQKIKFTFESNKRERLDVFLAEKLGKSRNQVQKMIEGKLIKVNGEIISEKSQILKRGDVIEAEVQNEIKFRLKKEDFPIDIIWEDENYMVINKPAGMVVHPSPHHTEGTLVNILLNHIDFEDKEISIDDLTKGRIRPGIVHRLDKEVSGVLLIAKNQEALNKASELFKNRKVEKIYIALCFGYTEKKAWEIDKNIKRSERSDKMMTISKDKGKNAITFVKVLRSDPKFGITLFEVKPITGRTHQIRVHMSSEGFPIINDTMYGGGGDKLKKLTEVIGEIKYKGIFLHSLSLRIFGKRFLAPLPKEFEETITKIFGKDILAEIVSKKDD